jgi:CheY-like chemotaxis protein
MARVLVVEDRRTMLYALKESLEPEHHVLLAPNGRCGLALYELERPDVVLADLLMPEMTGVELVDALQKIDKHARIIVLTCMDEAREAFRLMKKGVLEYLVKPCEAQDVVDAISRVLMLPDDVPEYLETPTTREVEEKLVHAATHRTPILVHGRVGSGRHTVVRHALRRIGIRRTVYARASTRETAGTLRRVLSRFDSLVEAVCLEFPSTGAPGEGGSAAARTLARIGTILNELRAEQEGPPVFAVGIVDADRPPRNPHREVREAYLKSPRERPHELRAMVERFGAHGGASGRCELSGERWLGQLCEVIAHAPMLNTVRFVRAAAMHPALLAERAVGSALAGAAN